MNKTLTQLRIERDKYATLHSQALEVVEYLNCERERTEYELAQLEKTELEKQKSKPKIDFARIAKEDWRIRENPLSITAIRFFSDALKGIVLSQGKIPRPNLGRQFIFEAWGYPLSLKSRKEEDRKRHNTEWVNNHFYKACCLAEFPINYFGLDFLRVLPTYDSAGLVSSVRENHKGGNYHLVRCYTNTNLQNLVGPETLNSDYYRGRLIGNEN